ncbi:MAG: hypothetical protein FWD65_08920 [Coriobacteriia bacterium]|nr:hypothetical protein [Coriobacteriia bacterium]
MGNWGYLFDKATEKFSLAPVYDCAGAFNPQYSDEELADVLKEDPKTLSYRLSFGYQTSAFRDDNPNVKMTLEHVLFGLGNPDCAKAVLDLVPKIGAALPDFIALVNSVETLSDVRKEYIRTTLQYRYENILVPAYQKLIDQGAQ